jgi:hypothetical protein
VPLLSTVTWLSAEAYPVWVEHATARAPRAGAEDPATWTTAPGRQPFGVEDPAATVSGAAASAAPRSPAATLPENENTF